MKYLVVLKHADHDQADHGNRDGGSEGFSGSLERGKFRETILGRSGTNMLQRVNTVLGRTNTPSVGQVTGPAVFRGFPNKAALEEFKAGEFKVQDQRIAKDGTVIKHQWGAGLYVSTDHKEARSYGEVFKLGLIDGAKLLSEAEWRNVPEDLLQIGHDTSERLSVANSYWASQGYAGVIHGTEIVIFSPDFVVVDSSVRQS